MTVYTGKFTDSNKIAVGISSDTDIDLVTGACNNAVINAFSQFSSVTHKTTYYGELYTINFHLDKLKNFNGISFVNGEEYLHGMKCTNGMNFKTGVRIQIVGSVHLCNDSLIPMGRLYALAMSLDFTMNAVFSDHAGNVWTPLPTTLYDIHSKCIRTTYLANDSCRDDPIRIFRALFFIENLKFNVDQELSAAIANCQGMLNEEKIVPEVINSYMNKMVKSGNSLAIYNQLWNYGVIFHLFPKKFSFFSDKIFNGWLLSQLNNLDQLPIYSRSLNYIYMVMIIGMLNMERMKKYNPDDISELSLINAVIKEIINESCLFKANFSTCKLAERSELIFTIAPKLRNYLCQSSPSSLSDKKNLIPNPHFFWQGNGVRPDKQTCAVVHKSVVCQA